MRALLVVTRFALADLVRRWRAMLALGVLVSLPLFSLTLVDGYVRTVAVRFTYAERRLVVQQQGSVGQLAGSRIPASVADDLAAAGVRDAVPEIHAVAGASASDAMLIVGVDPERYQQLDPYRLVAGRHLLGDESERTALLGTYLADRLDAEPGDLVRIRGRDVRVVGIFETGLYLDDAAILPLRDAQQLMGWGSDVSLYVLPADGPLADGDEFGDGLEVITRGDVAILDEWDPVLRLLSSTVDLLALGALLVLATAITRLAWLQRGELGVLRLLGLRRATVAAYLAVQSAVLVVCAGVCGVVAALVVGPHLQRRSLGLTTRPVFDAVVIGRAALAGLVVLMVALVVPLLAVRRFSVRSLLARDD